MGSLDTVKRKLEGFISKYYINELIRGAILFSALGLVYLLFILFIEYMLWLNPTWRTFLFWGFVAVELYMFIRFIFLPLSKLLKLRKGLGHKEASKIIGSHFPEVNDRLLNLLQLGESKTQSDLLMASIDQKSKALQPIPFKSAINFKSNIKYAKYVALPVLIILVTYITGNQDWFNSSYERVVNYNKAYEPPAPFQFFVLNEKMEVVENKPFTLQIRTSGEVVPETAQLQFNNQVYFLQSLGGGEFQYQFSQLTQDITFNLSANSVISKPYDIKVLRTPNLEYLEMELDYPIHTGKKRSVVKNSGNAIVPEGTKVTWNVRTKATSEVKIYSEDTLILKQEGIDKFQTNKQVIDHFNYSLVSSNEDLVDYERLAYQLKVVKDAYPEMTVESKLDSLDQQSLYFYGQASDDYGLRSLYLIYYKSASPDKIMQKEISIGKGNYQEFITSFPEELQLEEGVAYELYFELKDNDRLNGFKAVKSAIYNYRKKTKSEEESQQLQQQGETIKNMDEAFKKLEEQDKRLEEFSKTQKEKDKLNFNDKKKFESFLKRQKQQEQLMKNFNKNLQESLKEFEKEEENSFKEDLQKRLKDNEQQLEKDEKLLEELEKLQDKINKEDFTQKLEELAKQNQNKQRSMKQLLELTKRFYVANKAEKIQEELEKLAKDQETQSNKEEDNSSEAQKELNKRFSEIRKELEDLKKDNEALQKPMAVPEDKLTEERIEKDQQSATEDLQEKEALEKESKPKGGDEESQKAKKAAQKKQKAAAKKMQKMSENLKQMQMSGGGAGAAEQMSEDAEMLRQILDNLVLFSFDEEKLMNQFKSIDIDNNQYGKYIVDQNILRTHFEHIDDSLFALSLRQPKLSEKVNQQITNVYFNIDKALDQLTENRLYQGISYQQYTVTAANELASFLSDLLDNMEQQLNMMPGNMGKGDMQLPDIIMSQKELNEQMKEGMEKSKGDQKGKSEGEKPGEGEKSHEGETGEGDKSKEGKEGKEGENGEQPNENGEGSSGNEGEDGQEGGNKSKNNGYGEGSSEEMNKELYEIYQKQQQLRQALENKIQNTSGKEVQEIKNLIQKMEEVELDLINEGFTSPTMQKMMDLQHRLLKLENATFLQGEEERRESQTNTKEFETVLKQRERAKTYFNRTELLNRQALPLKDVYKRKVQQYFKVNND
jgi:hypothetical protein